MALRADMKRGPIQSRAFVSHRRHSVTATRRLLSDGAGIRSATSERATQRLALSVPNTLAFADPAAYERENCVRKGVRLRDLAIPR